MTRRIGLQWKLTLGLAVLVIFPCVVAYVVIGQVGAYIANGAAAEATASVAAMERSLDTYRDLFETTKRLHAEIADRLSRHPELIALDPHADLVKILDDEAAHQANLRGIAVLREDGTVVVESSRPLDAHEQARLRELVVDQPLVNGGVLRLTFAVSATLQEEYQKLNKTIETARLVADNRTTALPSGTQRAALVVMALVVFVAVGLGIFMSTIVTRRIEALVSTARRVSDGHVDARVELVGNDEMAELGGAFNTMLDDLEQTRSQIEYLQRIGAWQDVARKLAHEIKNPLTPIQLAVQETVSAYKGDDARFKKQLAVTKEIVEEEIEGLRRLVDTFRTLGQLPKVEKAPIALADVIEELRLDPTFAARVELVPPAEPVTVRADKLLLKRVLANLVENGIHAGEEAGDGRVVVGWRADPRGDSVSITIDDHGKGVAEADRERIFEPYVTTKPAGKGTGLGLAIARKIAIEHGGELAIAPARPPTGGARFVLTLPLRGPDASLA